MPRIEMSCDYRVPPVLVPLLLDVPPLLVPLLEVPEPDIEPEPDMLPLPDIPELEPLIVPLLRSYDPELLPLLGMSRLSSRLWSLLSQPTSKPAARTLA